MSLAGINFGVPFRSPLNILGGVAAVTAFDTLLVRLDLSFPARLSVLGLVLLVAIGLVGRPEAQRRGTQKR